MPRKNSRPKSPSPSSTSSDEEEVEPILSRDRKRPRNDESNNESPHVSSVGMSLNVDGVSADQTNSASRRAGNHKRKIIVLLDQAKLETVKTRKGNFELLNCDDHRDLCRKHKKDPADHRPDIAHQELLALVDSPLNKAGHLQVYIRTSKGILIEINPSIRVPRTFKRFSGLMVQLLHKMKIKASTTSHTLMKVIKNPFSLYLPAGTHAYGFSCRGTLYAPEALARAVIPDDPTVENAEDAAPICFVVGAMATGQIVWDDHPYVEKMISISEYPLSGAAAVSRLLGAIENRWGIV